MIVLIVIEESIVELEVQDAYFVLKDIIMMKYAEGTANLVLQALITLVKAKRKELIVFHAIQENIVDLQVQDAYLVLKGIIMMK